MYWRFNNLFFNAARYDLSSVGRLKQHLHKHHQWHQHGGAAQDVGHGRRLVEIVLDDVVAETFVVVEDAAISTLLLRQAEEERRRRDECHIELAVWLSSELRLAIWLSSELRPAVWPYSSEAVLAHDIKKCVNGVGAVPVLVEVGGRARVVLDVRREPRRHDDERSDERGTRRRDDERDDDRDAVAAARPAHTPRAACAPVVYYTLLT